MMAPSREEAGLRADGARHHLDARLAARTRRTSSRTPARELAFLGVPYDGANVCIGRPGSALGPQGLRIASQEYFRWSFEWDIDLREAYGLVDCGDTRIVVGNAVRTHENVEADVTKILEAARSRSRSAATTRCRSRARARSRSFLGEDKRMGYLAIDAHMDAGYSVDGEKETNCSGVARASELPERAPGERRDRRRARQPQPARVARADPRARDQHVPDARGQGARHGGRAQGRARPRLGRDRRRLRHLGHRLGRRRARARHDRARARRLHLARDHRRPRASSASAASPRFDNVELAPIYDLSGITGKLVWCVISEALYAEREGDGSRSLVPGKPMPAAARAQARARAAARRSTWSPTWSARRSGPRAARGAAALRRRRRS